MDDADRLTGLRPVLDDERARLADRTTTLLTRLPVPARVVYDASVPGIALIDVIEATDEVEDPATAYVALPRGYATVEFLRMLFAVAG